MKKITPCNGKQETKRTSSRIKKRKKKDQNQSLKKKRNPRAKRKIIINSTQMQPKVRKGAVTAWWHDRPQGQDGNRTARTWPYGLRANLWCHGPTQCIICTWLCWPNGYNGSTHSDISYILNIATIINQWRCKWHIIKLWLLQVSNSKRLNLQLKYKLNLCHSKQLAPTNNWIPSNWICSRSQAIESAAQIQTEFVP